MLDLASLTALCQQNNAVLVPDEPLSAHTTFKVGGPCAALITVSDAEGLGAVRRRLRAERVPHRLIGRGSNLLVPDTGYPGVVLQLGGKLASEITCAGDVLTAGAGVSLKNLCLAALEHSLTGLEFAYGIPGTVGGAVFMNAGAYGGDMSQVVTEVTFLDGDDTAHTVTSDQLALRYRHSVFMERTDWLILSASVRLTPGDAAAIRAKMQELLGKRQSKQPLEYPSAGSTFKRPAEDAYASKLIDECGLKGYRVGGAQVSEKHAGFVVNRGGATFADIMAVCRHVQETVLAQTGYRLELEPELLDAAD